MALESHSPNKDSTESSDALEKFLLSHNVPLYLWGTGDAKTLDHLRRELKNGECALSVRDGKVVRDVVSVVSSVYYQRDGETLKLIETKQVFKNGLSRVRNDWVSIGEKMIPGEDPEIALHRALGEELHINGIQSVIRRPTIHEEVDSVTYPGLLSKHTRYHYDIVLQDKDFKAEGYTEEQADKTSYFEWKKVDSIPGLDSQ